MATLFANAGPSYEQRFGDEPAHADISLGRFYSYPVGKTIVITSGAATLYVVPEQDVIDGADALAAGSTSSVEGKAVWGYGRHGSGYTISAGESTAIQAMTGYDASWIT